MRSLAVCPHVTQAERTRLVTARVCTYLNGALSEYQENTVSDYRCGFCWSVAKDGVLHLKLGLKLHLSFTHSDSGLDLRLDL